MEEDDAQSLQRAVGILIRPPLTMHTVPFSHRKAPPFSILSAKMPTVVLGSYLREVGIGVEV